jgi:hypothetical protein
MELEKYNSIKAIILIVIDRKSKKPNEWNNKYYDKPLIIWKYVYEIVLKKYSENERKKRRN